jgi:hypothetical protein
LGRGGDENLPRVRGWRGPETVTLKWIAQVLKMGPWTRLCNWLGQKRNEVEKWQWRTGDPFQMSQLAQRIMIDVREKFLSGMAAACVKFNEAVEKRCAIECIILAAAIIDGQLRMALILREQLQRNSRSFKNELLCQADDERGLSERSIFKMCRDAGIVDEPLFQRLGTAYDKRNQIIHRYLLSDANYAFAAALVPECFDLVETVKQVVHRIEAEQIRLGRGMTVPGPECDLTLIRGMVENKEHGKG